METVVNPVVEREQMIHQYAPLVKHVAGRIAMFLPSHIQMEDLLGDGTLGLLDAIDKFDHARGVQFKTYAALRIRGAIVDGLRNLDWVPRRVRRQARALEERCNELTQKLGRMPTREEIAEGMGLPVADLDDLMTDVNGCGVMSLEEVRRLTNNSEVLLGESIPDESQNVERDVEELSRNALLKEAIQELGERERLVLSLYYYEGLSIKEIAHVLSVSEPRVSQLHTRALAKMREPAGRTAQRLRSFLR